MANAPPSVSELRVLQFLVFSQFAKDVNTLVQQMETEKQTLGALSALLQQSRAKFTSIQRHLASILNFAKLTDGSESVRHLVPDELAASLMARFPDAINELPANIGDTLEIVYEPAQEGTEPNKPVVLEEVDEIEESEDVVEAVAETVA